MGSEMREGGGGERTIVSGAVDTVRGVVGDDRPHRMRSALHDLGILRPLWKKMLLTAAIAFQFSNAYVLVAS